jgi:hypothetical protein
MQTISSVDLESFFEKAYFLQHGEFYPENHALSTNKLRDEFPCYPSPLVDCLYRFAIGLDYFCELLISAEGGLACDPDEILRKLSVTFKYVPKEVIKYAISQTLAKIHQDI